MTHISTLNERAKSDERYHLLVLGRHGEGWHNVAEAKYGTKAWDVCTSSPLSDNADAG